jgi:hypothetical protein
MSGVLEIGSPTLGSGRSGSNALSASAAAAPGIQERAQGFSVGNVDKEPADPDPDLALAGP